MRHALSLSDISYGCTFLEGPIAFRVPWGLQMVPAVILAIGLTFLPESVRDVHVWTIHEACTNLI